MFWDSSAIIHLLVDQGKFQFASTILFSQKKMYVWWGSIVECTAALARLEREQGISSKQVSASIKLLEEYKKRWIEVEPTDLVAELACALTRTHPLRAGDSFQLAAALIASRRRPKGQSFYSYDTRLCLAAEKEGFDLIV